MCRLDFGFERVAVQRRLVFPGDLHYITACTDGDKAVPTLLFCEWVVIARSFEGTRGVNVWCEESAQGGSPRLGVLEFRVPLFGLYWS